MKLSFLSLALIITASNNAFASQSADNKAQACKAYCAEKYSFAPTHMDRKDLICYQRCMASCIKNAGQSKTQSPVSSPREKTTTK